MQNNSRDCIVWGGTGQAKVVYEILLLEGCRLLHLFDNNESCPSIHPDIPISYGLKGIESFISTLPSYSTDPSRIDFVVAIGGARGIDRVELSQLLESYGFQGRSVIHPSACISQLASVGKNVQIMSGANIGPFSSIDDYSIINTGANVDHDCVIGKAVHLAPNAALAGEVVVDDYAFIGTNATVLPRLHISQSSTVGAGSVVTKNVPKSVTVVGSPARLLGNPN